MKTFKFTHDFLVDPSRNRALHTLEHPLWALTWWDLHAHLRRVAVTWQQTDREKLAANAAKWWVIVNISPCRRSWLRPRHLERPHRSASFRQKSWWPGITVSSRRAHFVGSYSMGLIHGVVLVVRYASRALRPIKAKRGCAQTRHFDHHAWNLPLKKTPKSSQYRTAMARETPTENSHTCIWWPSSPMVGPMPSPYDSGRGEACGRARGGVAVEDGRVNLDLLNFRSLVLNLVLNLDLVYTGYTRVYTAVFEQIYSCTVGSFQNPWSSPKNFRFRRRRRSNLDQNLLVITNPVSDLTGDQ
jgi:hypothetical protein